MAKRLALGLLIGIALLAVLDAIAARMGLVPGVTPKIDGTAAWTTSRAAGVTAFVALTLDILLGLLVSTRVIDGLIPRARGVELHRSLSSITLALIAVHALVLVLDRIVAFDVLDALLPFSSEYRPSAVGLGVLAGHGVVALNASFWLRRRIGGTTWRKLHYLSLLVFPVAVVHGVLAGSDSGSPTMTAMYVAAGVLVGGLSLIRVVGVVTRSKPLSPTNSKTRAGMRTSPSR